MAQPGLQNLNKFEAITPSDTADFKVVPDAIYVGGLGNIVGVMPDNSTVTFTGVTAGTILPIKLRRINATLTTATALLACYQV
jgi:hypothetical protein